MEIINHEYYVSLEVANLLKEAGFDWECKLYFSELINAPKEAGIFDARTNKVYGCFDSTIPGVGDLTEDDILRPTLDAAQRWLREVKNIAVYVCPTYVPIENDVDGKWTMKWQVAAIHYDIESSEIDLEDVGDEIFDTCESALEAGIKKTLELILEKGK